MGRILLTVFVLAFFGAFAQEDKWYPGAVVGADNEVIVGSLLFQHEHDLVVVRSLLGTDVLPSWQIISFRYYDSAANLNRRFISLRDKEISERARLYEVVVAGNVLVVRREKYHSGGEVPDRDGFCYYFVRGGRIVSLMRFRTELYPEIRSILARPEREMRLNPNRPDHAIRYIQLYNQLKSDMRLLAVR